MWIEMRWIEVRWENGSSKWEPAVKEKVWMGNDANTLENRVEYIIAHDSLCMFLHVILYYRIVVIHHRIFITPLHPVIHHCIPPGILVLYHICPSIRHPPVLNPPAYQQLACADSIFPKNQNTFHYI